MHLTKAELGSLLARTQDILSPFDKAAAMIMKQLKDTGLADGIPAHHLTELALLDATGAEIAGLELHEPLEENPTLTFQLPPDLARGPVEIRARDNLGYEFSGRVEGRA